jgi:putative copper export protein
MWNPALLNFTLHSRAALALALQLAGLLLLLLALRRNGAGMRHFGVTGAVLIAGSFAATGHTSDSPERWLLGPFLALHLLIVEFWFGALLPLLLVTRHEPAAVAARIVQRFSRLATWTVPLILLAGVLIAARLLPDFGALLQPYGLGLSLKLLAFALLMGLAAVNRWRLAPALEHGGSAAARRLRDSVGTELVLIAAVLMGTATLTTFWSPGY